MRFKEFLAEREINDLDSVVEQVRKNCKPFLAASGGRMMFRGLPRFTARTGDVSEINVDVARYSPHPEGRKPRDSDSGFNFMFNAGCELAFDVKDIRKQAIFATGFAPQAEIYGSVHFFFPAGDFKFVSSSIIKDSYENSHRFWAMLKLEMGDSEYTSNTFMNMFGELSRVYNKNPHDWIFDKTHGPAETATAMKSEYPPNAEEQPFYEHLKDKLGSMFVGLYHDDGLFKFINKGTEVLFYETHGYYSIPAKMVMAKMKQEGHDHIDVPEDERIAEFLGQMIEGKVDAV